MFLKDASPLRPGPNLTTLFNLHYPMKALSANMATLVGLASTFKFWEDTFQSIEMTLFGRSVFVDVMSSDELILD